MYILSTQNNIYVHCSRSHQPPIVPQVWSVYSTTVLKKRRQVQTTFERLGKLSPYSSCVISNKLFAR